MATGLIPPLYAGLVDDCVVLSPGGSTLPEGLRAHLKHRASWYAKLVGPLLVPASATSALPALLAAGQPAVRVAVIADTGMEGLAPALKHLAPMVRVRQLEIAVARRGEDPQPGLRGLLALLAELPGTEGYAEIPLTWGLSAALDTIAEARSAGAAITPKFRTGGLAAELFPSPIELAAVICACRDRDLPFKLTSGLDHALRSADPETGFVHHGFLNVLVGSVLAAAGAEVAEVADVLATNEPVRLIEPARAHRDRPRPMWIGFATPNVLEPLTELIRLGLINGGFE